MATRGDRWADWLRAALHDRGWLQSEIVKASGLKDNGRPIIDASRVSQWINAGEVPRDPDILHEVARIFGVRIGVVLNAAGWLPDEELDGTTIEEAVADVAEAIRRDTALIEEARQHLLNQYELLRRLSPPQKSSPPRSRTRDLRAVAHDGNPEDRAEIERRAREARRRHEQEETRRDDE